MQIQRKVEILSRLGEFFKKAAGHEAEEDELLNPSIVRLKDAVEVAHHHNGWFSPEAVKQALTAWGESLNPADAEAWLKSYSFEEKNQKVGVIMAGNIPLVGLHDALCVLLSGAELHAKLSSKDSLLMPLVLKAIAAIAPEWKGKIKIVEQLKNIDVLIATGSDNSARYFDYYFKDKKKLIRKNRTSVAILNNSESEDELAALAKDIFTYYGLGCRNVTKVFLPKGYDLDRLFKAFFPYQDIVNHNKYANNYDYNKAVYLLNKIELIENGFILLKEDEGLHSPVGVLFYEYYEELDQLKKKLEASADDIQAITSKLGEASHLPFGKAQKPELWDYADGVDTLAFLQD